MPSYGEMIDLLSNVEKSYVDVPETLCSQFREQYPHIPIGRPDRFYDTVKRLAAPTRPSIKGPSKLQGSPLVTYRRRTWVPKKNNKPKGKNKGKILNYCMSILPYTVDAHILYIICNQSMQDQKI